MNWFGALPADQWLAALVLGAALAVFLTLVRWIVLKILAHVDVQIVSIVRSVRQSFLWFLALALAIAESPWHPGRVVRDAVIIAVAIQFMITGSKVLNFLMDRALYRRGDTENATAKAALDILLKVGLWVVVLLLMLENLGVKITTLLAGIGVGGIAIGLALESVASDLFASVSIMMDKPFEVGDSIAVANYSGTVQKIGIKSTRLKSATGEELIIPNTTLTTSNIQNFKTLTERRVLVTLGVTYDTPPDKMRAVPALVQQVIEAQDNTRFDHCFFRDFGASSMDFELLWYTLSTDYSAFIKTQEAVNFGILEAFRAQGIQFAYPTQTIIVDAPSGDGSAPSEG